MELSASYLSVKRLVLDGALCLADSFEFLMYHCMRLKALRHELASLNRIAADKSLVFNRSLRLCLLKSKNSKHNKFLHCRNCI